VVTGATGGVGSIAVMLLAHLGYDVTAVTGKQHLKETLLRWGARRVISRQELIDSSSRPLLSARWAGGVDTVGGNLLTSLLRGTKYDGCVAACGLVAGSHLEMSLYPFLLRGIALCGVASADCPRDKRLRVWDLLTNPWRVTEIEQLVTEVSLTEVPAKIDAILAGEIVGRVLINLNAQ
jgi:putative YhdH/YhfP family quinone oxidoreductase